MLKYANRYRIKVIGVASKMDSILLKASDVKLRLPKVKEADIIGMVPTSSTTISLLLGDCLATTVMYQKKFSKEKFKVFHPGGNIGKSLLLAKDIMLTGKKLPVTNYKKNLGDDFKLGKTTLPIILAWEKSNKLERKFWVKTIKELKQEPSDFNKALTILNKYNIFDECKNRAQQFISTAQEALFELPNTKFKEYLFGLADESIERSK